MYPTNSTLPITYPDGTQVTFGEYGMRICEKGSDMTFGDYGVENLLHIEKTELYKSLAGKGYKTVEFILLRPEAMELWYVEAKKTLPDEKNSERFEENLSEITQKFIDSFMLTCGIKHGEHFGKIDNFINGDEIFKNGNKVVFVLVIKYRKGKLMAIAEAIKQKL